MSTYIHRHLEKIVTEGSEAWPAIMVTGMRHSGKTTMLKTLAEKERRGRAYVSLEDLTVREQAVSDPKGFLQKYRPPVIIDEVQHAPALFTCLKIEIDEHQEPGAFWLCGSQLFRLMRNIPESLAGRVLLLNMTPLSRREAVGADCFPFTPDVGALTAQAEAVPPLSASRLFECVWRGGLPGLPADPADRHHFFMSLVGACIERDVRDIAPGTNVLRFLKFMKSAAARTARPVNCRAMAEEAGTNLATARQWLLILETLGIVFLLHPCSGSALRGTVRTPKLYFADTGLACWLLNWPTPEVAANGSMSGALLETHAVTEIIKNCGNAGIHPFLSFFRDRDGREIELLLERDGCLHPFAIRKTTHPDSRITRGFRVIDKSPLRRGTGAVLCMTDRLFSLDPDNLAVPIWLL
ncbi:MAG: AAA family ATPase [Desulfovibrionaceae bacterium]|nr:AAA family ATPase [Desulfovibrionaceae bacterium]